MEQRNEFDTSWGDYEAKRQWSYVYISLSKGWRIKLKAEKNKTKVEYDMVWCGTMQKKQHKTIELKKKEKEMRTEQDKPEQSRTK